MCEEERERVILIVSVLMLIVVSELCPSYTAVRPGYIIVRRAAQ